MTTNAKIKRQRERLFQEQGGLCYWCERPMVLPERYPESGIPPADHCTLDHLRDRFNPKRREKNIHRERRRVAACSECNYERSRAVCRGMGIHHPPRFSAPSQSEDAR